jgi:hypothetical protein
MGNVIDIAKVNMPRGYEPSTPHQRARLHWINERCPSYKEREFLSGQWQSPVGPPLSDKELRARIRAHHQKYGGDARGD